MAERIEYKVPVEDFMERAPFQLEISICADGTFDLLPEQRRYQVITLGATCLEDIKRFADGQIRGHLDRHHQRGTQICDHRIGEIFSPAKTD